MNIVREFPSGALVFTKIVGQRLVTHSYMGYTKREATRLFREKVRAVRKSGKN